MDQVASEPQVGNGELGEQRAAVLAARERLGHDLDRLDSEVRTQVAGGVQTVVYKVAAAGVALAAAAIVRKAIGALWKGTRKLDPPHDPVDPSTSWGDALAWTAATAVGVGVAKLLAARVTAAGWELATGSRPPGKGPSPT